MVSFSRLSISSSASQTASSCAPTRTSTGLIEPIACFPVRSALDRLIATSERTSFAVSSCNAAADRAVLGTSRDTLAISRFTLMISLIIWESSLSACSPARWAAV